MTSHAKIQPAITGREHSCLWLCSPWSHVGHALRLIFMPWLVKIWLVSSYGKFTQHLESCERFEPRSHFKSRLSLIVRMNVVLNRTVVVDSDWRFDNLCGSHLQSQSELYHVSWWYYTLGIDLIGQLSRDVIGRLLVKPWCYWLWRLVISNWCISIRLLSQLNSRLLLVKLSFSRS